jgi:DNA-binding MarR family transcriptional regulator
MQPLPRRPRDGAARAPADNILACVHVLSNRISRAFFSEVSSRHGVSLAEWRVILTLAARGGATAMEIAALWGHEKMAVSRAVARLARRGALRRSRDRADRRRQPLALTAAGRRLYRAIEPDATARYRAIVGALLPAERTRLLDALQRLIVRAEQIDPP